MSEVRTREQLYELVWKEPIATLAVRFGLSGNGLSKLCRRARVPVPDRGYWAKRVAGKQVRVPRLPDAGSGVLLPRALREQPPETLEATLTAATKRQSMKTEIRERLGSDLDTVAHPLVQAAKRRLLRKDGWNAEQSTRSAPSEVIAISVSKDSIERACRLASALFLELENAGAVVSHLPLDATTWICIGETKLRFELAEHVSRTSHEPSRSEQLALSRWRDSFRGLGSGAPYPEIPRYDYTATGRLSISAGVYPKCTWRDSATRSLEKRVGDVVVGMLALAAKAREAEEARDRRNREHQARLDAYQEALDRWTNERALFRRALKDARRWSEAKRLRRFATAVAASSQEMVDEMSVAEWVEWARKKADWLDPLVPSADDILDHEKPRLPGFDFASL